MITDRETSFVYISDRLEAKYRDFYLRLTSEFNESKIPYAVLKGTADIWAADYMPIQVNRKKFVQFVYSPDYLINYKKYRKLITKDETVRKNINLTTVPSDIIIDGGNVVRGRSWVILTNKIFIENEKNYTEKELLRKLRNLFEVDKIIIIPADREDIFGHADGMVRYFTDDTVLINEYPRTKDREFQLNLRMYLQNAGLDYIEIPYNPYNNKKMIEAHGVYINFLQLENYILLPTFELKEDDKAVRLFEELFKGQRVRTIASREISKDGGVSNCITWNIMV